MPTSFFWLGVIYFEIVLLTFQTKSRLVCQYQQDAQYNVRLLKTSFRAIILISDCREKSTCYYYTKVTKQYTKKCHLVNPHSTEEFITIKCVCKFSCALFICVFLLLLHTFSAVPLLNKDM